MKEIQRVDFQENWNNKLLCSYFTTIRPVSNKYKIGNRYAIYLRERFYCYADVIEIDTLSIQDIIEKKIHLLDTGKDQKEFIELMNSFYNKTKSWDEFATKMFVIYFKKIIQTDLFDQID